MPRRPATHTQADIARAIRAMKEAVGAVKVRMLPDGTTEIVPAEVIESVKAPAKLARVRL